MCTKTVRERPVVGQSDRARQGFTLVEIMIVVAIIGVLSAIAVPAWEKSRNLTRVKACVENLRMLQSAKTQWALDTRKTETDVPSETDMLGYLLGGVMPPCPSGGTYALNAVKDNPTCTRFAEDHLLP